MITDGIDSNLSPITTTKCCSNYDNNGVMGYSARGQYPSYIHK